MLSACNALKELVHGSPIGHVAWLDRALTFLIDLIFGPLTGQNTRYYWVFLAQALLLLAISHARQGGTLRACRVSASRAAH